MFRRLGEEADLRALESGHTVIRADHFANGGWCPPQKHPSRGWTPPVPLNTSHHHQCRTTHSSAQDKHTTTKPTLRSPTRDRQTTFTEDLRTSTPRSQNCCESVSQSLPINEQRRTGRCEQDVGNGTSWKYAVAPCTK